MIVISYVYFILDPICVPLNSGDYDCWLYCNKWSKQTEVMGAKGASTLPNEKENNE